MNSSPCFASGSSRKNGDAAAIGCTAEQTSCTNPGSVNSAERAPPPISSAASNTTTDLPARARVIAAASPFGPEPITTASYSSRLATRRAYDAMRRRAHSFLLRPQIEILATCIPVASTKVGETSKVAQAILLDPRRRQFRWHRQSCLCERAPKASTFFVLLHRTSGSAHRATRRTRTAHRQDCLCHRKRSRSPYFSCTIFGYSLSGADMYSNGFFSLHSTFSSATCPSGRT